MKFNVNDFNIRENDLAFMLCHSMKDGDAAKISDKMKADGTNEMDIHLTCNGIELDVELMLTRLYKNIDTCIKENARKLFNDIVSDKVGNIISSLYQIEDKCSSVNDAIDWTDLFDKFYDKEKYNKLAFDKKSENKEE